MADSKTEEPGRFEHYRLITDADGKPVKLGEGAMGVTYLAEDANLRVKVALKVIAPSLLGDSEIVQRFQREAQAAARLRHPNVAAVYHLGEVDDTFFYTMEFVEGRTLREHITENGPLTVKQALEVTLQMTEALGAAERHHMVHRDIKPANIMLETTEDGLHAKLIDFGLAKPLQHDAQQTSALLTQRGTFLGTAVFASPEQVQDLPLDTRSDFYALGLTLWVMLEGRPPFEGSLHKVLYDQVHTKPPLDRLLWAPPEVRGLLNKLLEKEPGSRPQTARELRQMIHDCIRAVTTIGSTQSDWQRRFQVQQAPRPQPWGQIYEGQDSLSGEVWLHFLRSDRFGDAAGLNSVIAGVRRAIEVRHPNVLRHVTVFPANDPQGVAGWMVVTEHPGQHTLLGHLQQVKQLTSAEAMPLIERLAEALDCCLASDLPSADLDAARIFLKPQSAPSGGPVEVVPKLIPVNYSFSANLRDGEDTAAGLTRVMPRGEARTPNDAVQRLATIAYQCLGGSWGRMTRYIPLPGLTQHQNEVLREALTGKKFSRAGDFMDALRQTKAPKKAAPSTEAEATVTLSPWERLAALAAPTGRKEATLAESKSAAARTQSRVPAEEAPAPQPEEKAPERMIGLQSAVHADAPVAEEAPLQEEAPVLEEQGGGEVEELVEPEVPEALEPLPEVSAAPEAGDEEPLIPQDEPEPIAADQMPVHDEEVAAPAADFNEPELPAIPPPAPAPTATAVRTSATELPLSGQRAKTSSISSLRETVEREWRDAKPLITKVTTPVRETVTTLPRWVFITFGIFVAVVGAVLWAISHRPVPSMPGQETEPANKVALTKTDPGDSKAAIPVTPPPPLQASLDQLLQTGTDAATRGNNAELLAAWQDMQKRFDARWSSHSKSAEFISAVAKAWRENQLGDPAKAAHDYLPIIAAAAKNTDVALLSKLSLDLKEDAPTAQPYELALLTVLSEDSAKSELLLDESLRLVQGRKTGAVAERARDLIRQTLEPLVAFRERWKRPEDMDVALRNGIKALTPKFEALAATEEPAALYLYADKLRGDGQTAQSITFFEKAAQRDHAPSMLQLGLLLSNLPDKATSLPKAAYWFKMADSQGYPQATFLLGECYLDGKGVPRDYDLALTKLDAAAETNIAEAHNMLGETYLGQTPNDLPAGDKFEPAKLNPGLTGEMRLAKARDHFEKALRYGFTPAGGKLAGMLITGSGGPRDLARAVQLLETAVKIEKPDPVLLRNYAYLLMPKLMEGVPVTRKELDAAKVKPDAGRVEQLMRQAARAQDAPAQQWCRENGVRY